MTNQYLLEMEATIKEQEFGIKQYSSLLETFEQRKAFLEAEYVELRRLFKVLKRRSNLIEVLQELHKKQKEGDE